MANLDMILANDITAPLAIDEFEKAGFDKVFDKEKIALIMDHFVPCKDIKSAMQVQKQRNLLRKSVLNTFMMQARQALNTHFARKRTGKSWGYDYWCRFSHLYLWCFGCFCKWSWFN